MSRNYKFRDQRKLYFVSVKWIDVLYNDLLQLKAFQPQAASLRQVGGEQALDFWREYIEEREGELNRRLSKKGLQDLVSQEQFDALLSIQFNAGTKAIRNLINRICDGEDVHSYIQGMNWKGFKGERGLEQRRAAEAELYTNGSYLPRDSWFPELTILGK